MLERAQELDRWLMLRVNRDSACALLDHTLPTFSSFAAWTPVIIALVVLAWWRGGIRWRAFVVCAAVAALLCEGVIGGPLKKIIGRLRPHDVMSEVVKRTLPSAKPQVLALFQAPTTEPAKPAPIGTRGRSFPSSHTVNMFAVAAVALVLLGAHGWWFVLIAAVVAWSRVYCGVHWPSDVIFSAPLGLLAGWLVAVVAKRLWKSHGGKYSPSAHRKHPELR